MYIDFLAFSSWKEYSYLGNHIFISLVISVFPRRMLFGEVDSVENITMDLLRR